MKAMLGLLNLKSGSVIIDGKDISGEDIVFDYENNSILNSENLRIKSENS